MKNTAHPAIVPLVRRLDSVENRMAEFEEFTAALIKRADELLDAEQHRTAFQRERAEYWRSEALAARSKRDELQALVDYAQQAAAARVQRMRGEAS